MTLTETATRPTTAPHVTVLVDRCVGCQECIVRCPTAALNLDAGPMVAVANDELCVGCRQCERTCPFKAITVSGPVLVPPRATFAPHHPRSLAGSTTETRPGFVTWPDAIAEADRCLSCPDPTCVRGCPAHNDIPAFIAAVRDKDLGAAHTVLRRTSVLPDICARVCDQAIQCEGACTWSLAGAAPVAIGALERFVCDTAPVPSALARHGDADGLRVAVIGSGPAGLAAAWELVEHGAAVTVYDRDAEPGGLLRWGIPDFTLGPDVTGRPVAALRGAGVVFRPGVEIGPAELDGLLVDHAALAHPGAVGPVAPGARVLVIGAGNTAMDVARTARRFGAQATCVDWMDRRFAAVRPDELAEAEAEGVVIRFSTTVEAIEAIEAVEGGDGRVGAVRLARTRQRHASGRPKVVGHGERVPVDLVVMAMGYTLDPTLAARSGDVPVAKAVPPFVDRRWVASGLLDNPAPEFARHQPVGALAIGRETARAASAAPRSDRVWVAGDALTGPATVVDAMAQGKQAALGVIAARVRARTTGWRFTPGWTCR